jgi:hypothetical protein
MNIGASLQQSSNNSGIRTRSPRGNNIASQELRNACNCNYILQADGFASQWSALRITPNKKSVCPGLSEDLFFGSWSAHTLARVLGLIGNWLVVWQGGHSLGAVVDSCEKSVKVLRLGWIDGYPKRIEESLSIARLNGVAPEKKKPVSGVT